MSGDPPELNLKIGPFSVSAKGASAVQAIRWPVAFAIASWSRSLLAWPFTVYRTSACYDMFSGGGSPRHGPTDPEAQGHMGRAVFHG
jgi:hypothetical protein